MTYFYVYSRRTVYALALVWSAILFISSINTQPSMEGMLSLLTRHFGLTALTMLFVSLTPGLIQAHFPNAQINKPLIHVRRSFGVSTFFFAVIHASLGFFHNLNGSFFFFDFLNRSHTLAIIFSTLALTILAAMALTSFDGMVRILGRKWKWLHRLVYVAALLVLAHANLIGSHFAAISTTIPKVINNLVFLFVFLEAGATLQRLQRTSKLVPKWQRYLVYFFLIVAVGMTGYYSHRSTTADANHGHEREAQ